MGLTLTIELEREEDGRWIAEVPELPGVMVYGPTEAAATMTVEALAFRVLAERIDRQEQREPLGTIQFVPRAA